MTAPAPLLQVRDLAIDFHTEDGPLGAVRGVSFDLAAGRTLGVVGESGCGKTMTALALLGLIPPPGRLSGGSIRFAGDELTGFSEADLVGLRGHHISMIFQEPMSALNPVMTIGAQIAEAFRLHRALSRRQAREAAIEALDGVGMPDAGRRAGSYPHQLSGGMRQRAMIAMALACAPRLLIADEATTALDTTIQAQILELLIELQEKRGMAILFISHNLGVISEIADEVLVMYAGRVVERAPAAALFTAPLHPYTPGLLASLPDAKRRGRRLAAIPGAVPDPRRAISGCAFQARCALADEACLAGPPALAPRGPGRLAACIKGAPG